MIRVSSVRPSSVTVTDVPATCPVHFDQRPRSHYLTSGNLSALSNQVLTQVATILPTADLCYDCTATMIHHDRSISVRKILFCDSPTDQLYDNDRKRRWRGITPVRQLRLRASPPRLDTRLLTSPIYVFFV